MKKETRPIVVIAGLTFLAMFNLTFIVPSLKEFIIDGYGSTQTVASLFVTVEMVAYIIFGVVWGAVSDMRGERRIFIVIGFFGSALLYYTMSLAPTVEVLLARPEGQPDLNEAAFRAWLDPANFDAVGRQRRSLADLRAGA